MFKRIIKTSFFSVGSRGFLTLTNLIIMLAVSRGLGTEKLGIYSISAFLYYLFSFLTSFELTTYFGKEFAHRRERLDEFKGLFGEIAVTFLIGIVLSLVTLLFLLLFYRQIDGWLMVISMVSGVIFGLEKNLSGVLLGREKMHYEFVSQATAFFLVAVPVFFFARRLDITGIYFLRIGASLVCIVLRGYFTRAMTYLEKRKISLKLYNWKEIKFFSASGLSFFVQHHIDLFILSFLITKQQEGAYFVALRIFLAFSLLAEMTSFALTPFISRSYRNEDADQFNVFYTRMFYLQVGLGLCASVILFFGRHLLVSVFAGEGGMAGAADFLMYFSFFIFFRFVSYYTGSLLTSTRYQETRFYILVSAAALMLLLELVLGKFFAAYGVIYARAVMEIFIFTAYLWAIAKIKKRPLNNKM